MFITRESLGGSWQSFERSVSRLLLHEGFGGVRLVGQTHDKGADIIAAKFGKRWLFQVKHWRARVGAAVVDKTLDALRMYRADVPVLVALSGYESGVYEAQRRLMAERIPLQLWDGQELLKRSSALPDTYPCGETPGVLLRDYQEEAAQLIVRAYQERHDNRALVVMATGLGKTVVAAEAIRRAGSARAARTLVIAHTNELVYQLERAFWRFLRASETTVVWNGYEPQTPERLEEADFVFACLDTVARHVGAGFDLPDFDLVLVDECHHVGAHMYEVVLGGTRSGQPGGPFLLGLTATPWRPDDVDLRTYFGEEPLACVDLVRGLRMGFLTDVDYRMYTDNIDWSSLRAQRGGRFSPKAINRTLFISEWDDAVVLELQRTWGEVENPRAIVFCGTIDHALTMRDRINALGFCTAGAVYSSSVAGERMEPYQRNRLLCDFHDGAVDVLCAVDILNEGVDVPDVNIVVFQRVTHSRRIFVQQLGRGLRLAEGKSKVIVLDFVSDIRRFAAGLSLKDQLSDGGPKPGNIMRIQLSSHVTFRRVGGEDPSIEAFLREWLEDVAAVEGASEDAAVLRYPPPLAMEGT